LLKLLLLFLFDRVIILILVTAIPGHFSLVKLRQIFSLTIQLVEVKFPKDELIVQGLALRVEQQHLGEMVIHLETLELVLGQPLNRL